MTHFAQLRWTVPVLFVFAAGSRADSPLRINSKSFGEYAPKELIMAAAAVDSKRDRMVVFGRELGEHAALIALDFAKETWTRLKTAGPEPEGTFKPGLAYVPEQDALYLFGGWQPNVQQPDGDLWRLDLSATEPLEWKKLPAGGTSPPARNGMVFALDEPRGRLLLHGGDGGPHPQYKYTPLDDLWAYDLKSNSWRKLDTTGDAPTPRWNHSGAIDPSEGKFYLFGGAGYVLGDNPHSIIDMSVYTLDLATLEWSRTPEMKRVPRAVQGASLTFDAQAGALVLVGGIVLEQKDEPGTERIYCFDLAGQKWTRTKETLSEMRRSHVAVYDPKRNQHVVFGGQTVANHNFFRLGDALGDSFAVTVRRTEGK